MDRHTNIILPLRLTNNMGTTLRHWQPTPPGPLRLLLRRLRHNDDFAL